MSNKPSEKQKATPQGIRASTHALETTCGQFTEDFKAYLKELVDAERIDELKRALNSARYSFSRE
ncbi:Uncharacterised protein [Cedecea neteri]|uniref:Uncharacterized protein n=1 Tax=Cedecea neteri TaxID=158822 RepID=A0A291DXF8_9ENTR|nr:hypothetical protein [Cedecea neteri]ATF92403.1 hypothetical protein CO704_10055 [Cedecea neteri]ATF92824.1 hypothetical protein CO704_12330 [Cedecea neteri]SQC92537.1 Uncharacterised protein [Cedecea neteri]SQC93428.1 Uncharacterised protein [Cedecea neteri]